MNSRIFERNQGYIDLETQSKLGQIKVLFAGCGVGSMPAEALARLGVLNFILIDGDVVEEHNLNRQAYHYSDIGKSKVYSLKKRILDINPKANVEVLNEFINEKNVKELVIKADFIFDTIDFLDLAAIVQLHDSANECNKPIFSLFTAGFGSVAMFIPGRNQDLSWIRILFDLPNKDLKDQSYTESFFKFFEKISSHLNQDVQKAMELVFLKLKDGIPCPAPHVISGALCASAIGSYYLTKYIKGETLVQAPEFVYLDLEKVQKTHVFSISN